MLYREGKCHNDEDISKSAIFGDFIIIVKARGTLYISWTAQYAFKIYILDYWTCVESLVIYVRLPSVI